MPKPTAPYVHEAWADLPGVPFAMMHKAIMGQVKSIGLKVIDDEPNRLTVETAHGLIGLRAGVSSETAGLVAAIDERWLFIMKNTVLAQIRSVVPHVAELIRWSDSAGESTLPPNFTFARVSEVVQLGRVFLRVTLESDDFSDHKDDSIHFRLVQPAKKGPVAWPTIAPNGSIAWPEGSSAVHKPVYTARFVDHSAHTLVTDVFVHNGGRTTQWAQDWLAGDHGRAVVGVVGPSGGGLLDGDHVLMASDETGFPAAARLLEGLPAGAVGEVLLEAEDGSNCEYPIDIPSGFNVTWLSRKSGQSLADATITAMGRHSGAKIWFAGERRQAMQVREAAKKAQWNTQNLRVSAFWRSETEN
ncbi:MAG: siderophore-interacting protein [Pseudomonadota bacterium]